MLLLSRRAQGDADKAVSLLEEALALSQASKDDDSRASTMCNLGSALIKVRSALHAHRHTRTHAHAHGCSCCTRAQQGTPGPLRGEEDTWRLPRGIGNEPTLRVRSLSHTHTHTHTHSGAAQSDPDKALRYLHEAVTLRELAVSVPGRAPARCRSRALP